MALCLPNCILQLPSVWNLDASISLPKVQMSSELLCKGDECALLLCEGGGPLYPVKGCDLAKTSPRRKQSPAE